MYDMLHGEYFYNYDKIRISSNFIGGKIGSEKNDNRHYSICFVENCKGYLFYKNKRVLLDGDYIFLFAKTGCRLESADGNPMELVSIDFKAELFGHIVDEYSDFSEIIKFIFDSSDFRKLDMSEKFYFKDTNERMKELIKNSWFEYKERKYKWEEVVKNNIYQIILEFVRGLDGDEIMHIQSDLVQSIVDYLEFNWRNKMTLESVAKKFNCSASHLTKLFKKEFGMSFSEYIKQRKIFASIDLLRGNYKIREVAKMVGYDDAEIFAKHFSYYVGMPPSEYRRKTRGLQPWYEDMIDLKKQIEENENILEMSVDKGIYKDC